MKYCSCSVYSMCVCVRVRVRCSFYVCAVLHRSFPSIHQSLLPRPCTSKAKIEFSSFFNSASHPGFNKACGIGWKKLGCHWVERVRGGGVGSVIATNSTVAWCWFGISLAPCSTVTHTRSLAQSYWAKTCLNPKWVFGYKPLMSTYPEGSDW